MWYDIPGRSNTIGKFKVKSTLTRYFVPGTASALQQVFEFIRMHIYILKVTYRGYLELQVDKFRK